MREIEPQSGREARRPAQFTRPEAAQASRQLSAYVYGSVLVLAALATMPLGHVASKDGAAMVLGVGISTFVAHLFADFVGSQIEGGVRNSEAGAFRMLRGSLPILSATSIPLLLVLLAWQGALGSAFALRAAEAVCIGRIALTGFFVGRYQGRPADGATWLGCMVLGAAGVTVVAIKILVGHG